MDLSAPIRCVVPTLDGPVLMVLARSLRPLSGREVARLVGPAGSQRGVLAVLTRLVKHGIVHREEHPPAALFRLNREHLAVDAILQLTSLRERLFEQLQQSVQSWALAPAYLGVYGSAACGDGNTSSDIDILVVRPDDVDADDPAWAAQLHELADQVAGWTGNPAETVEYAVQKLAQLRVSGDPFAQQLLGETRRILGEPLDTLLTAPTRR